MMPLGGEAATVHGLCRGQQPSCHSPRLKQRTKQQRSLSDGHVCPVRAVLHAAPGELPVNWGASPVQRLLGACTHICAHRLHHHYGSSGPLAPCPTKPECHATLRAIMQAVPASPTPSTSCFQISKCFSTGRDTEGLMPTDGVRYRVVRRHRADRQRGPARRQHRLLPGTPDMPLCRPHANKRSRALETTLAGCRCSSCAVCSTPRRAQACN